MQMYQAAELETVTLLCQSCVSQYPQICCLACCGLFFFFNSRLSRYYKPVHPSPLAFKLLLLEFFLFGIALSLVVRFHGS